MFERLNDINWSGIETVGNNSEKIPSYLLLLISDSESNQNMAYKKLENSIVRQGDLYKSAFYCIPFLIEIISSSNHNGKHYAYELLFEIYLGVENSVDKVSYQSETVPLSLGCQMKIESFKNIFISELLNSKSKYRLEALNLLRYFSKFKAEIVHIFNQVLESETNEVLISSINDAIRDVSMSKEEKDAELQELLEMFPSSKKK